MINLVKFIAKYILEMWSIPNIEEITLEDETLLDKKWSVFVTIYKNWEVIWSAWNIIELSQNLVSECILSTNDALNDERFSKKDINDFSNYKFRVDLVTQKNMLAWAAKNQSIKNVNPLKSWVITIKKDYSKLAVILPGISPNINTSWDMILVLNKKLNEEFVEENYIIYEIQTQKLTDF